MSFFVTKWRYFDMNEKLQFPTAKRLSKKQLNFLAALDKNLGIVTHAARETGTCRDEHYHWLKENPLYAEKAAAVRETVIDFVESSLMSQVRDKVPASTIFAMKCLGKHRGYYEKLQVEHSGHIDVKPVDIKNATDDELKRLIESATAAIASNASGTGVEGEN